MQLVELLHTWGFAVLGAVLLLVAFVVNRVAPQKRYRIRHALILYVLFLVTTGVAALLRHGPWSGVTEWADNVRLMGDLFAAFTFVNIVSLAVFDVALPAVGVNMVAITGDLIVGLAYIFAGFGVLRTAGVSTSSVFTTSAVVGGVLTIGLQATISNILGGFAIQLDGSVHTGDWVQLADGSQGKVVAIRWRHTVVETRNWDTLIVPNANLLAQNILILGKRIGKPVQHRMWVYFNVDFRYPPPHVIDVVRDALGASPIEGVAADPKPTVIAYDFAKDGRDSFGYYAARYWLTDLANDDPTSSRVRARIFTALKRAGIPLARPAQTLFFQANEAETDRTKRHETQRLGALEMVDLFHALTPEERAFVSTHLTYAPFTAGETCTHQGAVAHWLYVLCSGKVEIRRHVEGGTMAKAVAVLEGPTFFGEMGLMTGEPRTADVVALTDVDKMGLQRVLEQRPEAAEQFSKTLAKRRVELLAAAGGLDDEARKAKMTSEENRILEKIQEFFGLERTTKR